MNRPLRGSPSRLRESHVGTPALPWSAGVGQTRSVWLIWFVLFIWFIWFIRLVWFNQINKTNQTNQLNETDQTDRTDQMNKKGGGMELEIESRNVGMTPRWKSEIETRMADLQRRHEDL